jgi:LAS superfamily LD-carboxypeptidase LdcB
VTNSTEVSRRAALGLGAAVAASVMLPADSAAADDRNLADLDASMPEPGESGRAAGWGGHANGRIPGSALSPVPASVGQPYLRSDAAAAYTALSAAFAQHFGRALPITEAYRDLARQQALWNAYQNGTGNLAARPGTSVHGWALACDFGGGVASHGTPQKTWMNQHAPPYGWHPRGDGFAQREAWHFEYDGSYSPPPIPVEPLEDSTMYVVKNTGNGHTFVVGRHYVRHLGSAADVTLMSKVLSVKDEIHSLTAAQTQTVFIALGIPRAYIDATKLPHGGGGGWWSLSDAIHTRTGGSLAV